MRLGLVLFASSKWADVFPAKFEKDSKTTQLKRENTKIR